MRPSVFQVGGTLYWVIQTRNPDTMVLKDADSTPSVAVRKNGTSVGDSVTITKRSATTGIYDCSYNPAGEVEGDAFTLEESATVTGTTTSSATYNFAWNCRVVAVERGTDSANTTTPPTAGAVADAVWDEARSGHVTAGTFGEKVNAELDSSVRAQLDDIESDTTAALSSLSSITSAISAIAAIFTGMTSLPNWLRRAWRKDAGTAGMSTAQTEINTGGTATFAGTTDSQEAIKDALGSSGGGPAYSAAVVAARLPVGSAAGWPQEILCGAAYLTELGTHIPLYVKDVDENILAAMGDKTFADGDFKAILRLSPLTDANKLLAQPAATIEVDSDDTPGIVFNDDTSGEEYFELQIPKAKTALGEIRTRYLCQVILRWGDGSEYEWIVNLGESKFIRGVSAAA